VQQNISKGRETGEYLGGAIGFGGHDGIVMKDAFEMALRISIQGTGADMSSPKIVLGTSEIEKLLCLNDD
jgi:hypothetical protein